MRTRTATALLATLLLPLAACNSTSDAKPAATVTVTVTATPSDHATAASRTTYSIGDVMTWTDKGEDGSNATTGTSTVLSYKQPVAGLEAPDSSLGMGDGAVWGRVEVKVCSTRGDDVTVSQNPWSLAFSDGTRAEVTGLGGGDFPKPEYAPTETLLQAGDCIRGGIMFPVSKGQRPARIVYSGGTKPTSWTVPAK
jgi:hypothetical protein